VHWDAIQLCFTTLKFGSLIWTRPFTIIWANKTDHMNFLLAAGIFLMYIMIWSAQKLCHIIISWLGMAELLNTNILSKSLLMIVQTTTKKIILSKALERVSSTRAIWKVLVGCLTLSIAPFLWDTSMTTMTTIMEWILWQTERAFSIQNQHK